jgi:hypothetical protein
MPRMNPKIVPTLPEILQMFCPSGVKKTGYLVFRTSSSTRLVCTVWKSGPCSKCEGWCYSHTI